MHHRMRLFIIYEMSYLPAELELYPQSFKTPSHTIRHHQWHANQHAIPHPTTQFEPSMHLLMRRYRSHKISNLSPFLDYSMQSSQKSSKASGNDTPINQGFHCVSQVCWHKTQAGRERNLAASIVSSLDDSAHRFSTSWSAAGC